MSILPNTEPNQINWNLVGAADELLEASGTPIPLLVRMRDNKSLDVKTTTGPGWDAIEATLRPLYRSKWDDQEEIVDLINEVTIIADLTKRERDIVISIVEGDVWGAHSGGYKRLAIALRTTPAAVKMAWSRCRAKLVDNWAVEPLESTRQRKTLRKAIEGDGFNI